MVLSVMISCLYQLSAHCGRVTHIYTIKCIALGKVWRLYGSKTLPKPMVIYYTTRTMKLLGEGYISFTPSVRPFGVRPSVFPFVRPTSRVRSLAPTVLVGSISYLFILSSSFRRCVACNFSWKVSFMYIFFKICNFDLFLF